VYRLVIERLILWPSDFMRSSSFDPPTASEFIQEPHILPQGNVAPENRRAFCGLKENG
jgi:hypothetical protein